MTWWDERPSGGLIGFAASSVDGEYFDRHGNRGLKEIGSARFREYGYKVRWKLLGPGQPIDLSPRATYGQGDVREITRRIKGIENVLRVELEARALTESTPWSLIPPSH